VTALSEAAGGEVLPTLEVTLAYATTCGGDQDQWQVRWQEAARQLARDGQHPPGDQVGEGTDEPAPYLGLAAFQPDDADRFFGRQKVVDDLLCRLENKRFLAIFGPSGSGKSSLLRAGLIPAVRAGGVTGIQDWSIILLTPGEHPVEELAVHLAARAGVPASSLRTDLETDPSSVGLVLRQIALTTHLTRLLVVVDQFEEVFTLCQDEREQTRFIDALLAAINESDNGATVVLGVRADFYSRCADHFGLVAALQDAQVLLTAMQPDELRAVITQPAAKAGLTVEPALVATIVADVAGRPGALPLLSHALLETWRRRQGRRLTLVGYQAAGRVQGAITQTAEQVYAALNDHQQRIARRVFMRLTALGEGTEDTRRRVTQEELTTENQTSDTTVVINRLATARLLTLGEGTIEVAHEALIQTWPRLRQWLTDDRAGLRIHRQLTEAAQAWQALNRDPGALYRGTRLATAQEWADHDEHCTELNPLEAAFLDASITQETTEHAAAQRRSRHLRTLVAALIALLILTTSGGVWALHQRQTAISRQLATQATALAAPQPAASALLSAEAFRVMPTVEARGALLSTSARLANHVVLTRHPGFVNAVAFSPDGTVLASAGGDDHAIILWDPVRHTRIATLAGHTQAVRDLAFSPDGHLLASASRDRTIILWDLARRSRIATLTGHTQRVHTVAFSPDGRTLASASDDHQIMLWDVASHQHLTTLTGHADAVTQIAFSPDGHTLASASVDRTIMLWDLASRSVTTTLVGHADTVNAVTFSPDGKLLATASDDRTIMLWHLARRSVTATLTGHTNKVTTLAFSPDGRSLASGSNDQTIKVWDVATAKPLATLLGHSSYVSDVAFSPDGQTLASSSGDHTVIVWHPILPPFSGHTDAITALALSPDRRTLASASADHTIALWNPATHTRIATLPGHTAAVITVAFSPDGRTLASGSADRSIILWDLPNRTRITTLTGHTGAVTDVAFSPTGHLLASASADHTIALWNPATHTRITTLHGHTQGVTSLTFSPDGHHLASTSRDATVALWDITRRARITHLPMRANPEGTAAFSPDSRTLATSGYGQTIILWHVANRTRLATLQGTRSGTLVFAFSADGHTLASGGADGTINLWDLPNRTPLATLTGHTDQITGLIFGPDRDTLISASADHTIIPWNINPQQTTTTICTVVGRNLTHQEWSQFAPGISYHQTCSSAETARPAEFFSARLHAAAPDTPS
jgi:WD40 repeat protein/energy-coupling factor transporter ATP-binding protein EcfA2